MNSPTESAPLPSAEELLALDRVRALFAPYSRPLVVTAVRDALTWYRSVLAPGDSPPPLYDLLAQVEAFVQRNAASRIRPVVNATGILLPDALGNAPLPRECAHGFPAVQRWCSSRMDPVTGEPKRRTRVVEHLLCMLTGAEAALITSSETAAVVLAVAALCEGRDVMVPAMAIQHHTPLARVIDCLARSGVGVHESLDEADQAIGLQRAITSRTAGLLYMDATAAPPAGLIDLAQENGVTVFDAFNGGNLCDVTRFAAPAMATVGQRLTAGADVCVFAANHLPGGPQAGALVGRREILEQIRAHPFAHMVEADALTELALEQVLRLFGEPELLPQRHPLYYALARPTDEMLVLAGALAERLDALDPSIETRTIRAEASLGDGILRSIALPSFAVEAHISDMSGGELARRLRECEPPVVSVVVGESVRLIVRTLLDGDGDHIVYAFEAVLRESR